MITRQQLHIKLLISVVVCLRVGVFEYSNGELFTSVEDFSCWTSSRDRIVQLMDQKLNSYAERLEKLKQLKKVLAKALNLGSNNTFIPAKSSSSFDTSSQRDDSSQFIHPVYAFITLNRLANDLNEARWLLEEEDTPYGVVTDFEKLIQEGNMPNEDDAIGSGEALLRLQKFYNLKTKDLAEGKIVFNDRRINADESKDDDDDGQIKSAKSDFSTMMNFDDLFLLGKLATDDEHFSLALEWFDLAILRANQESLHESTDTVEVEKYNYLLEYVIYAAFKAKRMEYAAQLTKIWYKREPDNEKANDNHEYFARMFEQQSSNVDLHHDDDDDDEFVLPHEDDGVLQVNETKDFSRISGSEDEEVEKRNNLSYKEDKKARLCQNIIPSNTSNKNRCLYSGIAENHWSQILGMKMEILHDSPLIMRIYKVISDNEAQELQKEASTSLSRSKIGHGSTFQASKSRIAKTAWLMETPSNVTRKLKCRLKLFLNNIHLESAEALQVVNYGLGGFYDVHYDSFNQATIDEVHAPHGSGEGDEKESIRARMENNRLATVLIYLNDVQASGSTIFPELRLNVEPIKESAIIWFNLHRIRTTDKRTAHMGCPVLLGSKWIATIWPRERGNTFSYPCGLNQDD